MGFCLFNNVAIAARHALKRGVERIAIVDFDVHRLDPLAALNLEMADYAWITHRLLEFKTPLVSALEGGYHLQALAASVAMHESFPIQK